MILTFAAPLSPRPLGGSAVIYEFAGAMVRRGHTVHLVHLPVLEWSPTQPGAIKWFSFAEGIRHHFPPLGVSDAEAFPDADAIYCFTSEERMPASVGLPIVFIQGYQMVVVFDEHDAFHAPCPKVCVATWLIDVGREMGVPRNQFVHVPPGLRHDWFHVVQALESRPPRVAFCYNRHPNKGPELAIQALTELKRTLPELEVVAFSTAQPEHQIPEWFDFRVDPTRDELVDDIYNSSRIFMCSSEVEGFGLPCIEAMACGAALVTTDNGGSRDYAFHGRTALVSAPRDLGRLVANLDELMRDDAQRLRLAEAGREHVLGFNWDRSASELERFTEAYLADPVAFGRPAERVPRG